MQYIKQEYAICLITLVLVFVAVWLGTEKGLTTAIALLVGGFMNMISSLLALIIATQSNYRIAYSAKYGTGEAFRTLYKACCAVGFGVCSFSTLGNSFNHIALTILIQIIKEQMSPEPSNANTDYYRGLF